MSESIDLRLLSGAMAKVVLLLQQQPAGLTLRDISRLSGLRDISGLRQACRDLERLGHLRVRQRMAHGQLVWLLAADPGKSLCSEPPASRENQPAASPRAGKNPPSEKPDNRENPPPASPESGENRPADESLKDSRFKNLSQKGFNSQIEPGAPEPAFAGAGEREKRQWLEQAVLLFGKPVTWHASFAHKTPAEILAWLAQAREAWRAQHSHRPWGLVYKGLLGALPQPKPDARFCADPLRFLPDDYLRACGLAPVDLPEDPLDELDEPPEIDPLELLPPEQARIARAWQLALGQLERQMPRGGFETWLSDTRALDWDAESGLLRVLARDAAAVDWLESRIQSSAAHLLCGILNCAVRVQFVWEQDQDG